MFLLKFPPSLFHVLSPLVNYIFFMYFTVTMPLQTKIVLTAVYHYLSLKKKLGKETTHGTIVISSFNCALTSLSGKGPNRNSRLDERHRQSFLILL